MLVAIDSGKEREGRMEEGNGRMEGEEETGPVATRFQVDYPCLTTTTAYWFQRMQP